MISIKPKWVEKIINGEKTIEVRKTVPKLETPFKCFIYETKGHYIKEQKGACTKYGYGCGKVIGEFTCDEIKEIKADNAIQTYFNNTHETCLTDTELRLYATKGKPLYGLHISNLKIYDKPKELSEFRRFDTKFCYGGHFDKDEKYIPLKRPPQSWCYVEI